MKLTLYTIREYVYKSLVIVNLVVFVLFGLRIGIGSIAQRNKVVKELQNAKQEKTVKLGQISAAVDNYSKVPKYAIDSLNMALPDTVNTHDYLISLVDALSGKGFILSGYFYNPSSAKAVEGGKDISLMLIGDSMKSADAIGALEKLKQLTLVDSVRISFSSDVNLHANIVVY